ncbi:preprotein translocase subunit SecE [Anaeromicropila populeti]|uniref:Protein translocase subunit SecE n=1 Tax=Anaeromicropila populeti TaxID=37658 RepID=A0A1I6IA08_9FIRM|nr:preprotein translocase subunit SecE [Anaeromicropila populeti]SFR63533.1 preprotein translocase subunit SecE [Anaeromicropila populeti]
MGDTANTKEKAPKKSFFKGLKAEFKKIIWPDRESLIKQSAAVVVIAVVLGLIISIIDLGVKFGVDKILQIG